MLSGFDVATAAQSAAFFIRREGGRIDYLKLAKLMYLAERRFMEEYNEPFYYDTFVNMDNGPAPSTVLKLIDGKIKHGEWSKFVGKRSGNTVYGVGSHDLDHLSKAEMGVLKGLWKRFGKRTGPQLAQWTHDNCSEWQDPKGKPRDLTHQTVFRSLNKSNAMALADDVKRHRSLQAVLSGD